MTKAAITKAITAIVALLALGAGATAQAQVYRCPGPNGTVAYTDAPCKGGTTLDERQLSGNTVQPVQPNPPAAPAQAQPAPPDGAAAQRAGGAPGQGGDTAEPFCPSELEMRNMEVSANSSSLGRKEREFLQREVGRARACKNGNYTREDWKRLQEARSAQNRLDSRDRASARRKAEDVHLGAGSDRVAQDIQDQRMADELNRGQRRAAAAAAAARPLVVVPQAGNQVRNCDASGCWDQGGSHYRRGPAGVMLRGDGASCRQVGNQFVCN